jgi:hypothetical protein
MLAFPHSERIFRRGVQVRGSATYFSSPPHRRTIRELTSASLSITESRQQGRTGQIPVRSLPRSTAIPYAWVSTDVYLLLRALHAQLLLRPYAPSQDTLSSSWNQNNSKRPSSSLTSNAG